MNKYLKYFLFSLTISFVFSCSSNKDRSSEVNVEPAYVDERVSADMQRTLTDSISVLAHVRDYLDMLQRNEIDSALVMLYEADGDSVAKLSSARLDAERQKVKAFPVLKYQINKMQMFNSQDTRVHYTIEYFEKPEGSPLQNTLQCVIGLRRVGYLWYLIVPDETYEHIDDAI